jgi:hypothetical protein
MEWETGELKKYPTHSKINASYGETRIHPSYMQSTDAETAALHAYVYSIMFYSKNHKKLFTVYNWRGPRGGIDG